MNPDEFVEQTLAHFGVKGMRWGHKKAQDEANASTDHKQLKKVQTKAKAGGGTKALTNQELQTAITRMNLENQFSDLRSRRTKAAKGLAILKTVIGVAKTGQDAYNTGASIAKTLPTVTVKKN